MLNINDLNRIYLGVQGENGARPIVIDVRPWLIGHPDANISIWHTRNGESVPDPTGAVFDSEAGTITWTPTNVDTYVHGEGEAEIRLYENGIIKKTRKIITGVSPSVTGAGTPLGSGWQDYLDAISQAAAVIMTQAGNIKFEIDENGHLIFCYTDQIPVVTEEEDSDE